MKAKRLFISVIALVCTIGVKAIEQDTDGTYLIGSTDDWNAFASGVSNGTIPATANANLTESIEIWNPIITYSGVFDGGNFTITANITGQAPFANISGATIKNLKVDGTITGSRHCAGLVSMADGENYITHVTVSAHISSPDYCGGILGHGGASYTTIDECVFAGSIEITSTSGGPVGAICGWNHGGLITISNCIEVGSSYPNCRAFNPIFYGSGTKNISNCYYLNPKSIGDDNGTQIFTSQPEDVVHHPMELEGSTYFLPVSIEGIEQTYELKGEAATPEPIVTFMGQALVVGTDYTISYLNNDAVGNASLTITGLGDYAGSQTFDFTVFSLEYYRIINANDWKTVAEGINNGSIPANVNIRMMADIDLGDIQSTIGSDAVYYQGIFDGEGHTLTVHLTAPPFLLIGGATIRNLVVAGTVNGGQHTSGLVGSAYSTSTNLISNVMVSVAITTSGSHCGGFMGHGDNSNTTLQDCLFNGSITGGSSVGVLWGWSNYSTTTMMNCLENGTYTNCTFDPIFKTYSSGKAVVTNTYYVNGSSSYGTKTTAEDLADGTVTEALNDRRVGNSAPWTQDEETHQPTLKMISLIEPGTPTAIHELPQQKVQNNDWYSLDGRKLNGRPTERGIYIHNGRKVIMK